MLNNKFITSAFAQISLIIIAFIIMGTSSFMIFKNIVYRHLAKDSENMLLIKETEINSYILEAESLMNSYSEIIRSMILNGEDDISVINFMTLVLNSFYKDAINIEKYLNIYGYFYVWGGKYLSVRNQELYIDYDFETELWLKDTINADGQITAILAYSDISDYSTLILSRCIKDEDNNPLGVICIDVKMEEICKIVSYIHIAESGYGILLNKNLDIISHPQNAFKGRKINNINSGLSVIDRDLERGVNIYGLKAKNYMQENTISYFKRIKYDWFLGIIIPVNEYYKNVNNMALFIILIGSLLAASLSIMFYYIYKAKLRSDIRTRQKSNFLATMSHEIRTPLNAILGMTEIQMLDISHRPSTIDAFVKINNSGNLLLNIINDILDLSKIEAGKLELAPVKYETANLINDVAQLNYIRYESKPIDFIMQIDENIPLTLVGDDLRIKQILNNLLSNAFKYTESGHIIFSINAECVGRGGAILVTLVFQIKDTGQGMSSEQVNRLFDEYTRFNLDSNRTTEGAGLGMMITRNLVDLMFGKISVKSALGEGTTVTVRIPQKTDGRGISGILGKDLAESLCNFRHDGSMQLKKLQFTHEYMPYGRVLIVDDVETNLYVAKGLMLPYGLEIELAMSGFEAINKIKEGKAYDIIFMDHMMPKMDGIEAARQLRNMGYTYPIVALTANALAGQAEIFLQNGFDGFISKPIDVRHLNLTLNRMIRDKQSSEVIEAARKEKMELEKRHKRGSENSKVDPQLGIIFSRDAEKAVAVIESCLNNNLQSDEDIHLYIINIHAMKSALANIGESDLSAVALRLEKNGREKNISVLLLETKSFLDALRKVIDKIKPKNNNEAIEDSSDNLAGLHSSLVIIKEACLSLDKKTAKTSLNSLLENKWSSRINELLNTLSENLLHSEFDDAIALIDKYLTGTSKNF